MQLSVQIPYQQLNKVTQTRPTSDLFLAKTVCNPDPLPNNLLSKVSSILSQMLGELAPVDPEMLALFLFQILGPIPCICLHINVRPLGLSLK